MPLDITAADCLTISRMRDALRKAQLNVDISDAEILEFCRQTGDVENWFVEHCRRRTSDCAARNLSVLALAQGFTLWLYRAPHLPIASMLADGWFNALDSLLRHGDVVMISGQDGAAQRCVRKDGGKITLREMV